MTGVRTKNVWLLSGAALLLALGSAAAWLSLANTLPETRRPDGRRAAAPAIEPFEFYLTVNQTSSRSPETGGRMLWQSLRIGSNLSFDYVPVDRPEQQCVAENIADDLGGLLRYAELRRLLTALPNEIDCGPPCPACAEVALEWSLALERSTLGLTDRCWHTHPQLQPLRTAVEGVVAAAYGRVICS